jgi:hypothetical protein
MRKSVLIIIELGAAGCAMHPAPTEQIASSLAAVRGAEEAGAHNVPEADLQLELAQEEVAQAKQLMEQDENLRAEDRALRATNDAELALAIAREDASKKKLEQFEQANQAAGGESVTP